MNISKIQNTTTFKAQTTSPKDSEPKNNAKSKLTIAETVGYSAFGAGALALGTYYIFRGKRAPFKRIENKQIKELLENFKPHFVESKTFTQKKLKNGNIVVEFSGKNFDGVTLKDTLIFSKEGQVQKRILSQINDKTGYKFIKVYAGDKKILNNPQELPNGMFDPDYFVKQYKKNPMTRQIHDQEGNFFYVQCSEIIRPNGHVKSFTKKITPDNLPLDLQTIDYSVSTAPNKYGKHDFLWDTKTETDIKKYTFNFDDNNKLRAHIFSQSKKDGAWVSDQNVILNYINGEKGIRYKTHNQMYAKEESLGKTPKFVITNQCHDRLHMCQPDKS